MKFVFASDSFKGSLTCEKINCLLTETAKSVFPDCECVPLLIADGGEGTLEAVITQKHGKIVYTQAADPLGGKIPSRYGTFDNCALVCMSEASGLPLVPTDKRSARYTTSYGTGELIRHAVESGYKHIYVTLGGSATNDGGVGMLQALGYVFYDKDGKSCKGIGDELWKIAEIDDSNALDFSDIQITVLCDVSNPLLGATGATYTYGRQKGASDGDLAFLEKGMQNYAAVLEKKFGKSANVSGGGAAGGLGAALHTVFNATIQSGIKTVLDLCDFETAVKGASLVITGEGRVDFQSANGKVLDGVLSRANGVPVVAIAGSIGDGADLLFEKGLTAAFAIVNKPMQLEDALKNAETLYRQTAENVFRLLASKFRI
ncbi:MAG: glycerate kinase [Clostridiales bacterium]|nr:glycerate kinase [Clostridiales bacterium]